MTIKKLHHIGVAVPEIETALAFWQDALGLELSHVDDVPEQEAVVAFFPTGDSEVEEITGTSSRALGSQPRS